MARMHGVEVLRQSRAGHRRLRRKRTKQDQASAGDRTELCLRNSHDQGTPLPKERLSSLRNDGAVLNIDLDRCKRSSEKECSDTRCRRSQEKIRQLKMDRDIYLANETITLTTQPLELTCRTLTIGGR